MPARRGVRQSGWRAEARNAAGAGVRRVQRTGAQRVSSTLAPGGLRAAFLINLASAAGGHGLRFVVMLVLARLLVPSELGLVGIALALVSVAQVLRDLGVGAYLQREPELSEPRFASCLGVLCASTALLTLLMLAAAGPVAQHYGQPGLQSLLAVLLLGFVLQPYSLVMSALLQRDLAAGPIARVSRVGDLAHALTAVGGAALGWGAFSLAWAFVVNIVVCSGAYWAVQRAQQVQRRWRPSLKGWRPVLRFGQGALLNSGLAGVNAALPDLLLGRLGSVAQVGLLGRANAVVNLLAALLGPAVNFGMLRTLAELHHHEQPLGPALQRATVLLTGVGWPVLGMMALFHEELVALLYGPAWRDAAAAIPPLAAAVALGLLFHYSSVALSAIGRPHWAALPLGVSVAARCGLALSCFDGRLVSFAWALLGAAVLTLPVQMALAARCLGQSLASWLRIAVRSGLPCLAALGCAALLRGTLPSALAALAALLALPVWWLVLHWQGHELADEFRQAWPRLRSTIRK